MHTFHWPGAQIWFRHKGMKLVTASLLILCFDGYSCLRLLEWVFLAIIHVLYWSFLVLNFYGNLCNWIPKLIWPRCDWLWVFCWKSASSVDFLSEWTEIFKNCSIVFPFWRYQIFSMFSLRGILVCSLKMLVLFSQRILYYCLLSFRKPMKIDFLSFSVFHSIFFSK